MIKNQTNVNLNSDLTDSFDGIVSLSSGNIQTLTDLNNNIYLSFYTNSLLWSCGYNNPTVNRDINQCVKSYRNKPVDVSALLSSLSDQLKPHLSKKLTATYFESQSLYPRILKALLSKRNKTEFLCLEKIDAYFPKEFKNKIFSLKEWINDDPNAKTETLQNSVFPEIKTIKIILKKHRSTLAGCIINPIILRTASIAKKEKLEPFLVLLQKYNIPIIWDDSIAGFYRTGPDFSYKTYGIQPDILIYDGTLYNHRSVHFTCLTKKIDKLFTDKESHIKAEDIPNYIMLKALISFMESSDLTKNTHALGIRMIGKLRALEANSGQEFTIKGKGLVLFINFKTEARCNEFILFMKDKGILVKKFTPNPLFVFIYPPLIITEKNIDEIVEYFKEFFNQPA
ncbi:MAG: aminotransferase class III-fold pyridoxal phosphate-dependent enzyme [Eubacterium sp.]